MDKPVSLSVKQFLIRKMAVSLMVPEKMIEAVVNHQFNTMLEAMTTVNSVELSGFGKFLFNGVKARKKLDRHLKDRDTYEGLLTKELSSQRRKNVEAKLDSAIVGINLLKIKMHED